MNFLGRSVVLLVGIFCLTLWTRQTREQARADDDPRSGRKLAFLAGVKEYKHSDLKDLDYPENDVEELADVLKQQNFSVTVLTTHAGRTNNDRLPTADNIRRQLAAILKDVSKNDLIVVGLAGHGLQPLASKDAYFCPYDANPSQRDGKLVRPETLISIGEILGQFRDSGIGQRLLLVDACRDDPQIRSGRRSGGVTQLDFSALPPQTSVLLSCSPGEFSFEHKSLGTGHGVFFFHVIEGLKGAGHGVDTSDVTWDSLRAYVKAKVPATVRSLFGKDGGEQRPNEVVNLSGEPAVLARVVASRVYSQPAQPISRAAHRAEDRIAIESSKPSQKTRKYIVCVFKYYGGVGWKKQNDRMFITGDADKARSYTDAVKAFPGWTATLNLSTNVDDPTQLKLDARTEQEAEGVLQRAREKAMEMARQQAAEADRIRAIKEGR